MARSLQHKSKRNTQYVMCITYCVFLLLTACGPRATPTMFIPPPGSNAQPTQAVTVVTFATSTSPALDPNSPPATETPEPPTPIPACTDSLQFLEDITIPDGTIVSAGEAIDKQWRVQNDGSCDWDDRYLLKLVSGDALGLPAEMALYPARAGAEAIIQMTLTAPQEPGTYHTAWQAYNPDGLPFEQAIYVEFVVQ
jgi:hypothetical protein